MAEMKKAPTVVTKEIMTRRKSTSALYSRRRSHRRSRRCVGRRTDLVHAVTANLEATDAELAATLRVGELARCRRGARVVAVGTAAAAHRQGRERAWTAHL